jgi:hypothetical protein
MFGRGQATGRPARVDYVQRHLRFGWWSLLLFLSLGAVLEGLHGFKVGWYLDAGNDARRLMLTLAHAHGTLLALVHIVLAVTVRSAGGAEATWIQRASPALIAASVLLPGGFFAGGVWTQAGDAGRGVLLVPVGALALCLGVFVVARGMRGPVVDRA